MSDEITEKCGCGASITVPRICAGSLQGWRDGHRHEIAKVEAKTPDPDAETEPPQVDVKGGARIESVGRRTVGFSVEPNPGVRRWW